jgi:hypothetical protein
MEITKHDLHEWITVYCPDFEDADMYHSHDVIEIADNTWKRLEDFERTGNLSIDDPQGHEIYSCG